MNSILRFFYYSIIRDKFILGLIALLLISFCISIFFGSTALAEQREMIIAYIAGSSRIIIVFGIIIFITTHIHKIHLQKEIDFFLSKPISRNNFVLAYLLGSIILAGLFTACAAILLYFFKINTMGYIIWLLSLFFEVCICSFCAFICGILFKSHIISVLACTTFYIASRMMGLFSILNTKYQYSLSNLDHLIPWLSQKLIYLASCIIPRLDLFAESKWLIYEHSLKDFHLNIILPQTIIYFLLITFVAFHDIKKKDF
ncbi:MAG: hypothetical protein J0H68_05580 [Sphingobacteriia bacterium]|nr:hypothetical protein [Sphingobacteriia bacterium]